YRHKCNPAAVLAWLNKDLDTNHQRCTLAFWQDPYWTRPTEKHDRTTAVRPWIDTLYTHGVDVVLQASNHNYQRFAPQDPNDRLDPIHGIRAFVVGTGGISHYQFTGDAANVEASDDTTFGALAMTLHPYGYDWRFEPAWKGGFTDEGSGHCHDQPAGP
ncbi:MAG: alkaline phosphatase, partial [Actinobacteria bacterium]|nr:alkaline phosphatase [Actinomycetota bacterium]